MQLKVYFCVALLLKAQYRIECIGVRPKALVSDRSKPNVLQHPAGEATPEKRCVEFGAKRIFEAMRPKCWRPHLRW